MIQIQSSNPDIILASVTDVTGGKMIYITLPQDVVNTINWAKEYRERLEQELRLREQVPALAYSWNEYQTMLKIVLDQV